MKKEPIHYVPNLVKILDHYAGFISRAPTIIMGDFNASPRFDARHPRYLFQSICERLSELGLESVYHHFTQESFGDETTATLCHLYQENRPFHIDYAFLPPDKNFVSYADLENLVLLNEAIVPPPEGGYADTFKLSHVRNARCASLYLVGAGENGIDLNRICRDILGESTALIRA